MCLGSEWTQACLTRDADRGIGGTRASRTDPGHAAGDHPPPDAATSANLGRPAATQVRYRSDEDAGLDMHTDDSDVTFNVCLGKEFTGAGLTFCGLGGTRTSW